MSKEYDHKAIEKKWQEKWEKENIYLQEESPDKEKCYVLDMFPYPSGAGLHVGHPKGYIATDVYSRYKKMKGFNVLHPMGWDAFGLPAENYAIKNKVNPAVAVEKNVEVFKSQLSILGFSYDWNREVNTTDPNYYKWTQWAFIQMFKKGLAFESHEPINWCPECKTGLANEDLESDGTCERCGSMIEKKPLRQWVLKITDYADRLLDDLETLDKWPQSIKESQRNWIGRSEGVELSFKIKDSEGELKVFTTRPDTLYGVTYCVIAPEHSMIHELESQIENLSEVKKYIEESQKKSTIERTAEGKEKTGVELKGVTAINPVNQKEVPVWVGDYVLGSYGTGAVMAVPAHDERDFAFAQKYNLPIVQVIEPEFFAVSEDTKLKDGVETVERNAVCAIVKNPKTDEYLCVSWKKHSMNGFVTGGIDEGEDMVDAAKREVIEETGYVNLRHTRTFPLTSHSYFYHRVKGVNRYARFRHIFFDLVDEEKHEIEKEESDLHDVVWKKKDELSDFLTLIDNDFLVSIIESDDYVYTGGGPMINSEEFNGKNNREVALDIAKKAGGVVTKNYKLQDWVFSRQRYWGEPIPLIHCDKCGVVPVPEEDLPVLLPEVVSYEPTGTGESPLAAIDDWVNTTCPKCKGVGKRETNTMPQWAGSCWYYLRYMDPHNDSALVDSKKEKYWAPVDLYVGGAEHATRHLIYARFWHKFLFDLGIVSTSEPFERLISVGLILAEDGRKMSKRWGNVINPDDVVEQLGADSMRVYEMFMGPFTGSISWNTDNIVGSRRFIERVVRSTEKIEENAEMSEDFERLMHHTIKKVGEDIEKFSMNTAISQMMILLNEIEKQDTVPKIAIENLIKILSPFAPHVCDEIAEQIGVDSPLYKQSWPPYDNNKLQAGSLKIAVQVNGKVRDVLDFDININEEDLWKIVFESSVIKKWIDGKEIKKKIYIKGKIINIVIS